MLVALDGFLHDTRTKRLDQELRATLSARFKLLKRAIRAHYVMLPRAAKMDCRPKYIDFAFMPECRAIVDVPTSETVTLKQLTTVVPSLAERWEADVRKELLAYLRPHLGEVAADVDPLSLAIAVFRVKEEKMCRVSIGCMRYPAILTHNCGFNNCFRSAVYDTAETFQQQDTYTRTAQSLGWREHEFAALEADPNRRVYVDAPFHLDWLAGRDEASAAVKTMRCIVSALGLDPTQASFEDLEQCDIWLRCVTCEAEDPHGIIWARSWRNAVSLLDS